MNRAFQRSIRATSTTAVVTRCAVILLACSRAIAPPASLCPTTDELASLFVSIYDLFSRIYIICVVEVETLAAEGAKCCRCVNLHREQKSPAVSRSGNSMKNLGVSDSGFRQAVCFCHQAV